MKKSFTQLRAVDGIDITINSGEVVALLGPNGAGKSTTIDLVFGLAHPTAGRARLFGGDPRDAIKVGRVGAMLQGGALLPGMTVSQAVTLVASVHKIRYPFQRHSTGRVAPRSQNSASASSLAVRCSARA